MIHSCEHCKSNFIHITCEFHEIIISFGHTHTCPLYKDEDAHKCCMELVEL